MPAIRALLLLVAAGCVGRTSLSSLYERPGDVGRGDGSSAGLDTDGCISPTVTEFCSVLGVECGAASGVDSCGNTRTEECLCAAPDVCGGDGVAGHCAPETWARLGDSAPQPRSTRLVWPSASGNGVSRATYGALIPSVISLPNDTIGFVWRDGGVDDFYLRTWNDGWGELGGSTQAPGITGYYQVIEADVVSTTSGDIFVAFTDFNGTLGIPEVNLNHWNGNAWLGLGGSMESGGISLSPDVGSLGSRVAVDDIGRPVVAWTEEVGGTANCGFLLRWDGGAWQELGGSTTGCGITNNGISDLGIDGNGEPVVTWVCTGEACVSRFDGSAWVGIDGSATGGISNSSGTVTSTTLATNAAGDIIVAWADSHAGTSQVYLERWSSGAGWHELAGSASGQGVSASISQASVPHLATHSDGSILLAWNDDGRGYGRRWNGSLWEELGGSAQGDGITSRAGDLQMMDVTMQANGYPVVIWTESGGTGPMAFARAWEGTAWVELGEPVADHSVSNTGNDSANAALDVAADGTVTIAWTERPESGPTQIYLKRWNGSVWEELGGSASGGGVSTCAAGICQTPAIAPGSSANPVVAWLNCTSSCPTNARVHLRRWTGAAWEELGGSATDGGISGNFASSARPSVALDDADQPVVAWAHVSADERYAYVRRWRSNTWQDLSGSATGRGLTTMAGRAYGTTVARGPAGEPIVAWYHNDAGVTSGIYLLRWTGSDWQAVDGSTTGSGVAPGAGTASAPAFLAVHDDGAITLAWLQLTLPRQLFVARNVGAGWALLADDTTATQFPELRQSSFGLALDGSGLPVVTWSSGLDVLLRRWSGTSWLDVGGSSDGGGVSNSDAFSNEPTLAIGGGRACVAWDEQGARAREIVLRCTDGF